MVTVNSIISMLRDKQAKFAQADLLNPRGKESFDFGEASGRYKAYEQVLTDINDMLEEDKTSEKKKG